VISVDGPIWLWTGGQGSWHFFTVPEREATKIRAHSVGSSRRGFGSVRVEATVSDVSWRTSLFPQKSGDYILPIKADVRRRAGIAAGDDIVVKLDLLDS
jgi:hypothetical protein